MPNDFYDSEEDFWEQETERQNKDSQAAIDAGIVGPGEELPDDGEIADSILNAKGGKPDENNLDAG